MFFAKSFADLKAVITIFYVLPVFEDIRVQVELAMRKANRE